MVLWNEARAMCLRANGAKEFLQGYLTCNTDNISEDSYVPFARCDIKGRVLGNGWVTQREDQIFLIVHRSTLSLVRKHLAPYLNFSQCNVEDAEYSVSLQKSELDSEAGLFGYEIASFSVFDSQEEAADEDASEVIRELLISKAVPFIEAKASGTPLTHELRRMGIPVTAYSPSRGQDKIARMNSVAPIFESGMVWAPAHDFADEVIEEMASFPYGDYDDYCDSATMALMRFRQGGFISLREDYEDEVKLLKTNRTIYY